MNNPEGQLAKSAVLLCILQIISGLLPAQGEYEAVYKRLKAKIESEQRKPPASNNDPGLYLIWMSIKSRDRDEVGRLFTRAGREGNPYWQQKFFGLSDIADSSGEDTKSDAMFNLMRIDDRSGQSGGYQQACHAAGPNRETKSAIQPWKMAI